MEREGSVQLATGGVSRSVVARVDPQVEVPATLLAVGGDLADGCAVLGQHALLVFQLQFMATVAIRNSGLWGGTRVVVRRGTREKVPLGGVFVAWVVREKVVEQYGCCFAWRWAGESTFSYAQVACGCD